MRRRFHLFGVLNLPGEVADFETDELDRHQQVRLFLAVPKQLLVKRLQPGDIQMQSLPRRESGRRFWNVLPPDFARRLSTARACGFGFHWVFRFAAAPPG